MLKINLEKLLTRFLKAKSSKEVAMILASLGDSQSLELDQPFGNSNFVWHAFGDKTSNVSTINLATKPGRSLTERLTNAIDAILDERAIPGVPGPDSARKAASLWFGRPETEPNNGLYKMKLNNIDKKVSLLLLNSEILKEPTIDVLDHGIGIAPEEMRDTILSLHEGNKITKKHLVGAFGQGGSSTIAFSDYVLFLSRHKDNKAAISFSIVKLLNLSDEYKMDCFVYLTQKGDDGKLKIPTFTLNEEPMSIYNLGEDGSLSLPNLECGTLVRHYNFKLTNLEKGFQATPGNLYHFLHSSLFDPLLPFRIFDLRNGADGKSELVSGSRNRLMKLVEKSEEGKDQTVQMRHHRAMEFHVPFGSLDPCIGIEYWVVFHYRKAKVKGKEISKLRQSHETFVEKGHPIIVTVNGQNQGQLTMRLIKDVDLPMVARHIVVHIDATNSNKKVRRDLFSSTREGLKDGPVFEGIKDVLHAMLREDHVLREIEHELTKQMVDEATQSTSDEVKQQVTKLLLDAGLKVSQEGQTEGQEGEKESEESNGGGSNGGGNSKEKEPIPSLSFDEVTQFKITRPTELLKIRIDGNGLVAIETNADKEFDNRNLIAIRSEPEILEMASKSLLDSGHMYWRLRPTSEAQIGNKGKILASITRLNGQQIISEINFEILPERDKNKIGKGKVPPFDIQPINPDSSNWITVWPDLDECDQDEKSKVAYKLIHTENMNIVYYSTVFGPYVNMIEKLKTENQALLELFQNQYEIWIGYHAILQEMQKNYDILHDIEESGTDDGADNKDLVDKFMDEERTVVAEMQIKQALTAAKLLRQLQKFDKKS